MTLGGRSRVVSMHEVHPVVGVRHEVHRSDGSGVAERQVMQVLHDGLG